MHYEQNMKANNIFIMTNQIFPNRCRTTLIPYLYLAINTVIQNIYPQIRKAV